MFIPVTGTGPGKVMFVFGDPADFSTEERSCCCCRLDDAGVGTVPRIHRIGWRLMDGPRRLLGPEGRGHVIMWGSTFWLTSVSRASPCVLHLPPTTEVWYVLLHVSEFAMHVMTRADRALALAHPCFAFAFFSR
jgi:hypothetical protein